MTDPKREEVSRFPLSGWLLIFAGLLILALCTWAAYHQTHQANQANQEIRNGVQARGPRPAWLPDPRLTPGAVFPHVLADDVCKPGYATSVRNTPESIKREVCRRAGHPYPAKGCEIDHLVSLQLGGDNSVENLWVQPGTGKWSYHEKDALEARLHKLVCDGSLTLREAQDLIRGGRTYDWTLAYRRYVASEPKVMGAGVEAEPEIP